MFRFLFELKLKSIAHFPFNLRCGVSENHSMLDYLLENDGSNFRISNISSRLTLFRLGFLRVAQLGGGGGWGAESARGL